MSDNENQVPSEFQEFMEWMTAKKAAEAESQHDDEEIEIWDKDGRGARIRRSAAKPFLQSLGIDVDPKPESTTNDDGKGDGKGKARPTGKTAQNAATAGNNTIRKYFTKLWPHPSSPAHSLTMTPKRSIKPYLA
jgi:hypothetical protein